jgi:hypothetical protein
MGSRTLFCALWLVLPATSYSAPCDVPDVEGVEVTTWSNKVVAALIGGNACYADRSAFTNSDCNIFAGRVLESLFDVRDFVLDPPVAGLRYMQSNAIAEALWTTRSEQWEDLGMMTEQAALSRAQQRAQEGKAVIAVWHRGQHGGPGHIALVGPGPLTPSGSLKVKTPVSASFFQGNPSRNYVGKPLACAFGADKAPNTRLYARK